jgi:hypothetical protein
LKWQLSPKIPENPEWRIEKMTQQEQEKLQAEILATQREEIEKYRGDSDEIQWLFGEADVPDILKRSVYRSIAKLGKWTVCVIEQPRKAGVVTLLVIASFLLESQNFYYACPEHGALPIEQ